MGRLSLQKEAADSSQHGLDSCPFRSCNAGFQFVSGLKRGGPDSFTLVGMGPKLLISDVSTAGGRLLRW